METPARRFLAIVNPVSGRCGTLARVRRIEERMRRQGAEMTIAVTRHAGHATQIASQAPRDLSAILVAGGDGTVCEVINGLSATSPPLVLLRTGTENLAARELQSPFEVGEVVRTLLSGAPHRADVGEINGRRFLAVAGIGFDAECVVRMNQRRRGHITHGDFFWPIWRTFWAHRFPSLRVEADGELVFEGRGLALIGNIARYSVGLRVLAQARIGDGLLDICIFPCASRTRLMVHAVRTFLGAHMGRGGVVYRQGRTIRIDSPDRVPIEIDGEPGGHLPATCEIVPDAVTYLLPPATRARS